MAELQRGALLAALLLVSRIATNLERGFVARTLDRVLAGSPRQPSTGQIVWRPMMALRDTPSQHRSTLWLAPSVAFALSIITANASGNDKAPLLILALLAALTITFCAAAFALAFGGTKVATWLKPLGWGTFLPLAYTGAVLVLSRFEVIDSLDWLGVR